MATFTSKINGNDIYAKRAEATRKGVNLETYGEGESKKKGILPAGLVPGHEGTNDANILATQQYVLDQMEVADALMYKGTVNSNSDLPDGSTDAKKYKTGWTYKVATAGTYAGKVCEVGDMIIANKDWASGATQNNDWDVVQANIDGAVVNNSPTATNNAIAVFDNSGRVIKDSQVIIETTLSASSDANVPTSKAVNTAITNAINDLDVADITGFGADKTLATLTETDGKIAATFQDINITSDKVTDRQQATFDGTKDTLTTGKAVKAAIDALDAEETSSDGTNVQVKVTEVDGKVIAVNITKDTTAANDHVHGNITNDGKIGSTANLAVVTGDSGAVTTSDLTTVSPTATSDEALEFIDTVSQDSKGKISATKKKVKVVSTYSGTGTDPVNGTAVKAAIDTLDVTEVGGAGKYVSAISETDGKIAPTVTTMDITPTASSTNAVTSGGVKTYVDDALDALDADESDTSNGITVGVAQTNGKIVGVSVTATPATAGGAAGLVSYDTVEL